jgi:hypothetical protein
LTECKAVKFIKSPLGENEFRAVLQRIDQLTVDEAQMTAAQTLEVVYGLVQNLKIVMEGEQSFSAC